MNVSNSGVVPISDLFYDDAGPHIVQPSSAPPLTAPRNAYTPARGQELRALLDTSITQLGAVSGGARRRTPVLPAPVPVESLLYSGRAALERAIVVAEELRAAGATPSRDTLDELLDLVRLAASE